MMRSRLIVLLPLFSLVFALGFPVNAFPQATLTVENAVDVVGACTTVDVSLGHADDVRGIQMELCDAGDYLVALDCKPAPRVPAGYSCSTNELDSGCASIILFPSGVSIPPGTGPVLTITYGVFGDAPVNDLPFTPEDDTYSLMIPNSVRVADGNGDPLSSVDVVPGTFQFISGCTTDADCPDDGIFCNGIEVCQNGQCVEVEACPPGLFCDETLDACRGNCSTNQECDDGLFCNGVETCQYVASLDAFFCTPGFDACASPTPFCDESNDICVECLDDGTCDDNVFCNGAETCVNGSCQASPPPCPPLSVCDEVSGECLCSNDAQCDDGLFCNGVETCGNFSGTCDIDFNYSTDYPCLDCLPNLDDCDCNEGTNTCQPVTLTVGSGTGLPGSVDNPVPVSLDTLFQDIGAVQMDVCDPETILLTCSGCETTGRTPGAFSCAAVEQPNGCCRVALLDLSLSGAIIPAGAGPILTINYTADPAAPAGGCRLLDPQNVQVANATLLPLAVDVIPGDFCFSASSQSSFSASAAVTAAESSANNSGDQAEDEMNASLGMDLWKKLFEGARSDGGLFPFTISENCPLATFLDDPQALATLREFRDKVLSRDINGIIFTYLFYRNASELTGLLKQNEDLVEQIKVLVDEYSSLISEVNDGEKAYLGDDDKDRIIGLLEEIKAKGSQQLKGDIDLVIEELKEGTVEELFGFTS